MTLLALDRWLSHPPVRQELSRLRRLAVECGMFGLKEARACLFIWLAENISTFFSLWRYPNQAGAWSAVHLGKWSAWSLLVIMTFTIVVNLKHLKARIHVPR